MSEINCVFCGVQKMMETSKDFAVHPYVPATFQNKTIYMCIPCLQNWKEFRQKAINDNQLILKDEVNEELCGKGECCSKTFCVLKIDMCFLQFSVASHALDLTPQASVPTLLPNSLCVLNVPDPFATFVCFAFLMRGK